MFITVMAQYSTSLFAFIVWVDSRDYCLLAKLSEKWFTVQQGSEGTQYACFSCLTYTKHFLLVTFCDTTSENGAFFGDTNRQTHTQTDRHTDGQTDFEVEIVI